MQKSTNEKSRGQKLVLLFVYNADSDLLTGFKDYFHKIVKPSSYGCNLCAVTFGKIGMKKERKSFIDDLEFSTEFYHKDEFTNKYPSIKVETPQAFIKRGNELSLFISQSEFNGIRSLDEMIKLVKDKIKT